MPGEIKIPGIGDVDKKYVIAGVVVGAGIAVVVYVRGKNKAAVSSSGTSQGAMVTDPAGNQCASLDPNSGFCPGTPEDTAYQEQSTGSYGGLGYGGDIGYAGSGVSSAGLVQDPAGNQCSAVSLATGYCPGTPQDIAASGTAATATTGTGTTGSVSTNSDWLEAALGVVPGDSGTVQAALAAVLAGLTVTTAQKNLFLEAVGILGNPPQGYPQPIKTSDTSAQPGTSSAAKTSTAKAGAISNLAITGYNQNGVSFSWNPATGATQGYHWVVSGNGITKSGTTTATHASTSGLDKPGVYNIGVQALPGGPGNNIHTPALKA